MSGIINNTEDMRTKILVVIAAKGETNYVSNNANVDLIYSGMGKVNALSAIGDFFERDGKCAEDYVVFNIGTCGSPHFPIESVVIPEKIMQGDTYLEDAFLASTYEYDNAAIGFKAFEKYARAESALTSDQFINAGSAIYEKVRDKKYLFEMEAYALAHYAKRRDIPFYCVKVVSDNCDGTMKDWAAILEHIRPTIDVCIEDFCKEM